MPASTTWSPGTAWGREPLVPAATIGSKETLSPPRLINSYTSRAAISRSVIPGRIKFRTARNASSVISWARRMRASSPPSLEARRASSSSCAGVRMPGSSCVYLRWLSTVMVPLSKPMLCSLRASMYSLARAMWLFSGVARRTSAPSICSCAASM